MFKHIKQAIVYSAELPKAELLAQHLAEMAHQPIGETELIRASFVPNRVSNELVTEFEGGLAFDLRIEEKILPKSIVRAKAKERVKELEDRYGRMKKVEREAIFDQVLVELAKTALVKTAIISAFYRPAEKFLIVAVGSKRMANILVGTLIQAVGSVKTTTIHVSDIKNGLTTRLKAHLDGADDAFDGFEVGTSVSTVKITGEKVTYALDDLESARKGLVDGLANGFQVTHLALARAGVDFKLTSDFHFKAVRFADADDDSSQDEGADTVFMWRQDAAVQALQFSQVISGLCDLLGYKEPEEPQAEAA